MSTGRQIVLGLVVVTAVAGVDRLHAQAPGGAGSAAPFHEGIAISIHGVYQNAGPVEGRHAYRHHVKAQDIVVDLETSKYPGLQEWLDRSSHSASLKSGATRVQVSGQLVSAASDAKKPGDHCRLVCEVTRFVIVPLATAATAESPNTAAPGAVTPEDMMKVRAINEAGGLAVFFDPKKDPAQTILKTIKDAGLRVTSSDPATGLLFADLPADRPVDPWLIRTLRSLPATRAVESRAGSTQKVPPVRIPGGETPSLIDRGTPR